MRRIMPKTKEKLCDNKCSLCSQKLGPKGMPFHGMKNQKCETMTVLEMLLPPQDFSALCDGKLFPNPEICAPCLFSLKKVPTTLLTLQKLMGKSLNIRLYKPNREAWTASCEKVKDFSQGDLVKRNSARTPFTKRNFDYEEGSNQIQGSKDLDNLLQNAEANKSSLGINDNKEVRKDNCSFQDSSEQQDLEQSLIDVAPQSEMQDVNSTLDRLEVERSKGELLI